MGEALDCGLSAEQINVMMMMMMSALLYDIVVMIHTYNVLIRPRDHATG
eukprot:SAG11_NODE_18754_length_482_cov_0.939948_1_plen_48_part_01